MSVQLGDGIRLLSGAMFDYNNPLESDVQITDIAGALSKVCRFAGHIGQFYSVAQHAVNASLIVEPEHAFDALMHDTAEAFTNDLPTPLKFAIPIFKELEVRIESAMAERFGFTYPLSEEVKLADLQMLSIEKVKLKRDYSAWGVLDGIETAHVEDRVYLCPMTPLEAEQWFLARYAALATAAGTDKTPKSGLAEGKGAGRRQRQTPSVVDIARGME